MAFIYKISNKITGQSYIGKTTRTLNERFSDHIQNAKTGKTYLYSAMRKYGKDNFELSLVEECEDTLVDKREIFWIDELNTRAPAGYNMTAGGTGGDNAHSPNFVSSMKDYHSVKPKEEYATFGFKGKTHSNETKHKQATKRKQHWDSLTNDQRKTRCSSVSGNKNGMFGKVPRNAVKIEYEGVEYNSLAQAARILRMSPHRLKKEGKVIK